MRRVDQVQHRGEAAAILPVHPCQCVTLCLSLVHSAVIVGGIDMMSQSLALAKKPHVIIATPGRLLDHLENTKGFTLRSLRFLIMDEADRILNMDFETEVDKLLKVIPRDRKTFLFSATMTKKNKRLGALNKFKSKSRSILLATDVASRGLDIPHVDVVINFDIPTHSKDYIHRVGRTARAGRSGKSITFVSQYDVELFQRIEHLIDRKLPAFPTQEEEVMLLVERELREEGEKRKRPRHEGKEEGDSEQSRGVRDKIQGGRRGGRGGKRGRVH
ncbi:UNVERIFIED_CONTAM: hypothetical protein FKN15_028009 [Acipenser sinensis]